MQAESLKDHLGACHHLIEDSIRLIGRCKSEHLHLVELVHPDQSALLRPGSARFSAKTGGISDEFFRQVLFFEDLIVKETIQCDLGGWNEIEIVIFIGELEKLFF